MPKKYIETVGVEEFRKNPIGSGPWKFVRSVSGDRVEYEAINYPHWRGTPQFKNLTILLIPEESTRVAMVRTGEAAIGSIIAVLGAAVPSFWLGIGLIYIFSVYLGVLPSARMGGPEHYILPALTLGTFAVAGLMRLVRSSMLEILDAEFVKLARIKGLSEAVVIWKHCLRNATIPVLSLFGVLIALLVTGAIVTETVFAWPGVGRLAYEAVIFRDYPLLQAVIILKAVIVLGVNLAIDILHAYVDPRIRYG
jgi:ABC-type dipeptide/oligopeptide/nickel transport system permease component